MKPIFALVDCNNFFVSCERVFAPEFKKTPVAVVSGRGGIIVSRSNETKALGIPMAAPVFKHENIIKKNKVKLFGSNFALYGDFSDRIMSILHQFSPAVEVYSIDEAFLQLSGCSGDQIDSFAKELRQRIWNWTGIPVSVGVASTKTLAKAANELAKKHDQFDGVLNFVGQKKLDPFLAALDVADVWGVGRSSAYWLKKRKIQTAFDLKIANPYVIKKNMGAGGARTLQELQNEPFFPLQTFLSAKKTILSSRSFQKSIPKRSVLEKAIRARATTAAEKLRKQKSVAFGLGVFVATNRFSKLGYRKSFTQGRFHSPTADTSVIIKEALSLLKKIYKFDCQYKRAGIVLTDIAPQDSLQLNLLQGRFYDKKRKELMNRFDQINRKWGTGTIAFAQTKKKKQKKKETDLSPCYTTDWNQLLRV